MSANWQAVLAIIFRKEIYATPCILGGFSYFLLREFVADTNFIFVIAGLIVIITRLIAVRFKISLPSLYKDN